MKFSKDKLSGRYITKSDYNKPKENIMAQSDTSFEDYFLGSKRREAVDQLREAIERQREEDRGRSIDLLSTPNESSNSDQGLLQAISVRSSRVDPDRDTTINQIETIRSGESFSERIMRLMTESSEEQIQEQQGYFKPRKEDIRVGFQYQILENGEWKQETVASHHDIMSPIIMVSSNLIRVPYLTDQILTRFGLVGGLFKARDQNKYQITILPRHEITIINQETGEQIYKGGCKCINSLRIILRLLKLI